MKNKVENPSGNFLLFYGHRKSAVVDETCLSQFYGCRFSVGGKVQFREVDFDFRDYADAMKAKSIPVLPWVEERVYF